ncbi:uncharacterized protein LOC142234922 [Haematobia irritans]|uniref:uncharacterized protein LOC142234922 n=1 Tax=Haematobia irritans TaxID=7368 RepID=UPI003F5014AB
MTNKTIGHINNTKNTNNICNSRGQSNNQRLQSLVASSTNRFSTSSPEVGSPLSSVQSASSSALSNVNGTNNIPSNSQEIHGNISKSGDSNRSSSNKPLRKDTSDNVANGSNSIGGHAASDSGGGAGKPIKAYAHGIWYQDYDTIDNSVQQHIKMLQQQLQCFYANDMTSALLSNNPNGNVPWPPKNEVKNGKLQQHPRPATYGQHKSLKDNNNTRNPKDGVHANNCDIVVVDIENEEILEEFTLKQQQQHPGHGNMTLMKFLPHQAHIGHNRLSLSHNATNTFAIDGNTRQQCGVPSDNLMMDLHQKCMDHVPTHDFDNIVKCQGNDNKVIVENKNDNDEQEEGEEDEHEEVDDDDSSLASMETLSDNVSIWIEGEKHWIAGVDAHTTCADLIWALLHYQSGYGQEQNVNANNIPKDTSVNTRHDLEESKDDKNQTRITKTPNGNQERETPSNTTNTNTTKINTSPSTNATVSPSLGNGNQSMPKSTKEQNSNITENSSRFTPSTVAGDMAMMAMTQTGNGCEAAAATATILPCTNSNTMLPYTASFATASQLATEYVIVKQYHHCEVYLDGSTKVFDVLPPRNSPQKKECELLLRRLGPAPMSGYAHNTATPQMSSLISTDKDSGMGSPVGSARSAKFRRRKHKSSQWLAQANTLHPKLSRCTATANERLLKIILAQDETIQRQLSLLREKERQINKIEEEKHRKRERELGKNYLLETYLNGLDEADCELDHHQEGEEIFIDDQYQSNTGNSPILSITATVASSVTTQMMASHKDTLAMDMLDNFRPRNKNGRDAKRDKKEKKKRYHKEKSTVNDESTRNGQHPRDKEERLLKQLYGDSSSTHIPGSVINEHDHNRNDGSGGGASDGGFADASTKADMEMQILWWEKVYSINKQLQKEEEQAAKLQAKIRKHQLKKANQTQKDVQLEMDKLDHSLALQCGSIRRVEANLMETNEQLQKKLLVLERLSLEYLRQQQIEQPEELQQNIANEHAMKRPETVDAGQVLENSKDNPRISLSNIKSVEEVEQLQKLIAKPGYDATTQLRNLNERDEQHNNKGGDEVAIKPANHTQHQHHHQISVSVLLHQQPQSESQFNNDGHNVDQIISSTGKAISSLPEETLKINQDTQPIRLASRPITPSSLSAEASLSPISAHIAPTKAEVSSVGGVLDKNMLSSLHVQHVKTIKKQMFHTQTSQQQQQISTIGTTTPISYATTTTQATTIQSSLPNVTKALQATSLALGLPTPSTTMVAASSRVTSPITITSNANSPKPMEIITSCLPVSFVLSVAANNQEQSQNLNQQPLQHTTLPLPHFQISGPTLGSSKWQQQNSHPVTSRNGASSLVAPINGTRALALPLSAMASTVTSSPASLMAMNTVDISQLGTLV